MTKKPKRTVRGHSAGRGARSFRAALVGCALVGAGAAAVAAPAQRPAAAGHVAVEVGGRRLLVNANTLQQGPLTQEQAQQIADALKDNKSTQGLVEVRHGDGSVSMDLGDRFQNVTLARTNDDGSLTTACVDTPEAAAAFLRNAEPARSTTGGGTGAVRKAPVRE